VLGDLAHESLAMLLVGPGRPSTEMANVFTVVLAEHHVDPWGAREVEARLGVSQDLVEMRGHAPPGALALQQPEGKRSTAERVGVERVGAQPRRELLEGQARTLRQRLPDPQFPGDLEQVGRMVTGDQFVELADLVGQRRSRRRSAVRHRGVPPVRLTNASGPSAVSRFGGRMPRCRRRRFPPGRCRGRRSRSARQGRRCHRAVARGRPGVRTPYAGPGRPPR
jgi:hypothetical protein